MVMVSRGTEVRDVPDSLYSFMLSLGYSPYLNSTPATPAGSSEPAQGSLASYDQATHAYRPQTPAQVAASLQGAGLLAATILNFSDPDPTQPGLYLKKTS